MCANFRGIGLLNTRGELFGRVYIKLALLINLSAKLRTRRVALGRIEVVSHMIFRLSDICERYMYHL